MVIRYDASYGSIDAGHVVFVDRMRREMDGEHCMKALVYPRVVRGERYLWCCCSLYFMGVVYNRATFDAGK